jgi:excisionase family DNA binding protein
MLLTARQAAAALVISESTLFRHLRAGTIPAVHIGGCLRFDPRDLTAFIDRLKTAEVQA